MRFKSREERERTAKEKVQEIYRRYHPLMWKIAYDILHESQLSEDAVYDAFVTIIEKVDEIEWNGEEKMPALIGFIVRAKAIDIIRKRSHLVFVENPESVVAAESNRFEAEENAEDLLRVLDSEDANLLRWRILEGRDYSEIAERLNITESTARKRIERAKKKLKKRLEEEGER